MIGKRQYSLSYLLLDIFWWAVALASVRALDAGLGDSMHFALFILACATIGAAVGGLFRQMFLGAGIGLAMVLWIVWIRF